MNFQDRWEEDEQGNKFIFTVEMQRRLSQAGLPIEPASLSLLNSDRQPQPEPAARPEAAPAAEESYDRSDESEGDSDSLEPDTIQIDPQTGKYLGRLKWYNPSRGYGFISRGGGEDIFFHRTAALIDPAGLDEGQWLLYDVEDRKKGPEATDVELYKEYS